MKIIYDVFRKYPLIFIRKIRELDKPFLKLYTTDSFDAVIQENLTPMRQLLRRIKYKILWLIDSILCKENQYCYLYTIKGRILLVEPSINCLYILSEDFELIRCFLPRLGDQFLKSSN